MAHLGLACSEPLHLLTSVLKVNTPSDPGPNGLGLHFPQEGGKNFEFLETVLERRAEGQGRKGREYEEV